ncbi:recombinase RecT, partial [Isoptericola hypogeus]|uniref:recombinase RecT n=1 Tax=Isoptericola hypogeus TaxID=300179 RepID=UPI0031D6824D
LIGRRAADLAGEAISVGAPEWCTRDGQWGPVWSSEWGVPLAARVTIERAGQPFTAVALFDEYKQTKSNGDLTQMWQQRPGGQIAKCAEALAWRMAFPQDLAGVYVEDELHHADSAPPSPRRRETAADVIGATPTTSYDDTVSDDVAEDVTEPISDRTRKHVFALLRDLGVTDPAQQRAGM